MKKVSQNTISILIVRHELFEPLTVHWLTVSLSGITKKLHPELLLNQLQNIKASRCNQQTNFQSTKWLQTPF